MSVKVALERCANCGAQIGALETPCIWQEKIVCGGCHAKLNAGQIQYAMPAPPALTFASPARSVSGLGVASLILGLLGIISFCVAPLSLTIALIGAVLGIIGWFVAGSGARQGVGIPIAGTLLSLVPFGIWLFIVFGIGAAVVSSSNNAVSSPASVPSTLAAPKSRYDQSAAGQQQYKRTIEQMIHDGLMTRVEKTGTLVELYVTPAFASADEPTRQKLLDAVYGYYFSDERRENTVEIIDDKSSDILGKFTSEAGLKMN